MRDRSITALRIRGRRPWCTGFDVLSRSRNGRTFALARRVRQTCGVRPNIGFLSVATLAWVGGCLSEVALDNYHDGLGSGGAGGYSDGRWGNTVAVSPEPWGNNVGSIASLGFGYLKLPDEWNMASAGTAGYLGETRYQVTGYWQAGSKSRLEFGVSDTDHVIILFEATCVDSWIASEGSLGRAGLPNCPGLVELTSHGDQLRFVQFPSAAMPEVAQVTPTGEVVLAGKLDRSIGFGAAPLGAVAHGFYVAKLDRDWHQEFAFAVSTERDVELNAIQLGLDGAVYVAASELDFATSVHSLVAYHADGTEMRRWSAFPIRRLVATQSGGVLAAGWRSDEREIGGVALPEALKRDGVLCSFDAVNGTATPLLNVSGAGEDEITAVTEAPGGGAYVGGKIGEGDTEFGASAGSGQATLFVAQLSQSAQVSASVPLSEEGSVTDLLLTEKALFVSGYLQRDQTDGRSSSSLFVSAVGSSGEPEPVVGFDAQPATMGRMRVDSKGTIWLSAFGQINLGEPKLVSAIYRIERR